MNLEDVIIGAMLVTAILIFFVVLGSGHAPHRTSDQDRWQEIEPIRYGRD